MISKYCPCCNQKFTFFDYIAQEFKKNSVEDGELNIVCKECHNTILLADHNKKYSLLLSILYFLIIICLIMMHLLTMSIVMSLFVLFFILQYLIYLKSELKCYTKEELHQVKKDYKSDMIAIILIALLFFGGVLFGFYSFATKMKEPNKAKIQTSKGINDGNV